MSLLLKLAQQRATCISVKQRNQLCDLSYQELRFIFLMFSDEEDSGENDTDVPDREKIKKQSQFIVDSKTKRRTTKKKKKAK